MSSDIIQTFKGLLINPTDTLQKLRDEPLGDAFIYFLTITPILVVLLAIVSALELGSMSTVSAIPISAIFWIGYLIAYILCMYVGCIIGMFISSAILHIFVYFLGGRNGFDQTAKAVIYSYTPAVLLGWIPILGLIGGIWSLVLEILAVRELHEISTGRAVLAVILAILSYIVALIMVVVMIILMFGFFMILISQPSTLPIDQAFLPTM